MKKVSSADIVMGIGTNAGLGDPLVVQRRVDPNITHPLRQKDVLDLIGPSLNGVKFTSYIFQALVQHCDVKSKEYLYWSLANGAASRYSREIVTVFKQLTQKDIETALTKYRKSQKKRRNQR